MNKDSVTGKLQTFDGFEFTSVGKVVKDDGFTKYLKDYKSKKNEDIELLGVKVGDVFEVENKEKFTKSQKHFTEDILLKAMEVAGNDNLEKDAEVERKGISLVTIVSDIFKSAEITAKWEMELSDIAQGKSSKEEFLKDIEKEIRAVVLAYSK